MRILYVLPYPASRIRSRSYGFITAMPPSYAVTMLALCADQRELREAENLRRAGYTVQAIYEPKLLRYLRGLGALWTARPLQVAFDASRQLRDLIGETVRVARYDVLHVELLRTLGALPYDLPLPVVWDAVDCLSNLYSLGAQAHSTVLMSLVGRSEARRASRYEREQLSRFQHVTVTAERERAALLKHVTQPIPQISLLPNGVDQEYFCPYQGQRQQERLVFSGKMSFHANIAGAHTLVSQILPLVWRQRPTVKLTIAGSNPPYALRQYARDARIEVTGYLADLRPPLEQSQIALCTLPYAVGVQNKVIEAMAVGTPVIASQAVAAGLQARPGQDLLVANSAEECAAHVLRLLEDRQLWQQLSQNGIHYVQRHHNWHELTQKLLAIYKDVVHAAAKA